MPKGFLVHLPPRVNYLRGSRVICHSYLAGHMLNIVYTVTIIVTLLAIANSVVTVTCTNY